MDIERFSREMGEMHQANSGDDSPLKVDCTIQLVEGAIWFSLLGSICQPYGSSVLKFFFGIVSQDV